MTFYEAHDTYQRLLKKKKKKIVCPNTENTQLTNTTQNSPCFIYCIWEKVVRREYDLRTT